MIELDIKFKDFLGKDISEKFAFHLDYPTITAMEMEHPEGIVAYWKSVIATEQPMAILDLLRDLMIRAVGRRSEDGRRFVQNDEIRDDFQYTGAYSALFIQLATNEINAIEFMNGMMPADLHEKSAAITANKGEPGHQAATEMVSNMDQQTKARLDSVISAPEKKHIHQYTHDEFMTMSDAEFASLAKMNKGSLPQTFLVAGMQRITRD